MTITLLDLIIALILLVCFIMGFWNGLTKQLATIGGIVLGVVAAARLAPWFAGAVTGKFFVDAEAARIAAYIILFIGAAALVWVVGLIVRAIIKKAELGFTDRLWGAGFGLVKGVVFSWALLLAIVPMKDEAYFKRQLDRSYLAPRLLRALNVVRGAFPRELSEKLRRTVERSKRRLSQKARDVKKPIRRDYR